MGKNTSFLVLTTDWRYNPSSYLVALLAAQCQQVSRSKRFHVALDLDAIYRFLSQWLRSIIQSSPTSSPFRPIESHHRAAVYEESIEPQFIVDFEVIDVDSDIEWPSWCNHMHVWAFFGPNGLVWNVDPGIWLYILQIKR